MTAARTFDTPLPPRMQSLPVDKRGFPVPAFVEWIDGEPDFRVMNPHHLRRCIDFKRCWICGWPMGKHLTFVIGPMCCVNRISAEPPSHHECGKFAAIACPFLSKPLAKRPGVADLEAKFGAPVQVAGVMIPRNPGVTALWTTKSYTTFRSGGILFELGDPERVEFYRQGRAATRQEIEDSVGTGLPILAKEAAKEEGGAEELAKQVRRFESVLANHWEEAA